MCALLIVFVVRGLSTGFCWRAGLTEDGSGPWQRLIACYVGWDNVAEDQARRWGPGTECGMVPDGTRIHLVLVARKADPLAAG